MLFHFVFSIEADDMLSTSPMLSPEMRNHSANSSNIGLISTGSIRKALAIVNGASNASNDISISTG